MVRPGKRYTFAAPTSSPPSPEMIGDRHTRWATHRERFYRRAAGRQSLWYPLRYPAEYTLTASPRRSTSRSHYHYPTADDMAQILSLRNFRDFGGGSIYDDSFGFLDQNPHNTMHIWTGGMNPDCPARTPAAVGAQAWTGARDRNRGVRSAGRRFHTARGSLFPAAIRRHVQQPDRVLRSDLLADPRQHRSPLVGVAAGSIRSGLPADLDAVLTPWSYTIRDTLDIRGSATNTSSARSSCRSGLETPVGRFVSQPIAIPEAGATPSARPRCGCIACRSCRAPASSASS